MTGRFKNRFSEALLSVHFFISDSSMYGFSTSKRTKTKKGIWGRRGKLEERRVV